MIVELRSLCGTIPRLGYKVKIIIAPTYDDSRAKIALWNDPQGPAPVYFGVIQNCVRTEFVVGVSLNVSHFTWSELDRCCMRALFMHS